MKQKIIGICGNSGSGKTALTHSLAKALNNSSPVFWDDFESFSEYPSDYIEWYKSGKDYTAWKTPVLAEKLKNTKCAWVIFDAPLGRNHIETGQYIDFLIFLDTPLDIALARRIKRDYLNNSTLDLQALNNELDTYLKARPLFLDTASLQAGADLTVDGTLSIDQLVTIILEHDFFKT